MNENAQNAEMSSAIKTQNLQTQLVNIFAPDDNKDAAANGTTASALKPKIETQTSINKNFIFNKVNQFFYFIFVFSLYLFFQTCWVSPSNKIYDQLVEFLKSNIEKGRGETLLEIGTAGK